MTTFITQAHYGESAGWENLAHDDNPEDAYLSIMGYRQTPHDTPALRTVMMADRGVRLVVEIRRDTSAGGVAYLAQCAVDGCIAAAHLDGSHIDADGYQWREDIPIIAMCR